ARPAGAQLHAAPRPARVRRADRRAAGGSSPRLVRVLACVRVTQDLEAGAGRPAHQPPVLAEADEPGAFDVDRERMVGLGRAPVDRGLLRVLERALPRTLVDHDRAAVQLEVAEWRVV